VRVAVDVMGGDRAPQAILKGCWDASWLLDPADKVLLVGDQDVIREGLAASGLDVARKGRYDVVPTTQVITMDDPPVEAIRNKPDSSIAVMCRLASKGEADVVISAGNTGAMVAATQMRMRTLKGVSRPGIAVIMPGLHGPFVICDCGANIAPKPKHMQQWGIMAGAYLSAMCGAKSPRVGLLSIGEEDAKGTTMVKEARKLMRDEPLMNFIGNVEGRDLFHGVADVVICDGFVGNIVLKLTEGLAEGLFRTILQEIQRESHDLVRSVQPVMQRLITRHDYQEYGGAPLLGISGYALICHGRSDSKAIMNAIRAGKQLMESRVNEKIVQTIENCIPVTEE